MKILFSALLITSHGPTVSIPPCRTAVSAQAGARCEARRLFQMHPDIESIEIVILEGRAMFSGMSEILFNRMSETITREV
jgi:hypothetical protein